MTPEQINQACAELDGYEKQVRSEMFWHREMGKHFHFNELPNYTTSYDAIIPLIQKQSREIQEFICANTWWTEFETDIADMVNQINATPPQLCEALLRAHNKWQE